MFGCYQLWLTVMLACYPTEQAAIDAAQIHADINGSATYQIIRDGDLSQTPPPIIPTGSALADLANSLAPGESAFLNDTWAGGDIPTDSDINWNNRFHYDEVRGIAYMSTKRANNDTSMTHAFYDAETNTWLSENTGFNAPGHAYDITAYDYETGNVYTVPGGHRDERVWKVTWSKGQPVTPPVRMNTDATSQVPHLMYSGGRFGSSTSAMDWNPDILGGALVISGHRGLIVWTPDDNYYELIPSSAYANSPKTPSVVTSRNTRDTLLCINKEGNRCFLVNANGWSEIAPSPMQFGPDAGSTARAALIDDPQGSFIAFEKQGAHRVWKLINGLWVLQSYAHPFGDDRTGQDWLVAAVYGLNVFWALERTTGAPRSRVWRPK